MRGDTGRSHDVERVAAQNQRELAESSAGALMSDEMLANATAHGRQVDLDQLHDEALAIAAELGQPPSPVERADGQGNNKAGR